MEIKAIPLSEIHADEEFNCRGKILPIDVVDLARDIQAHGLIQPVMIRPYDAEKQAKTGCKYLLIMGYRRYKAHLINETETIDAIINEDITDEVHCRVLNLSENLKRKDLNILQEALAISKLKYLGIGRRETAKQLGMSEGWVQLRFMLLDLPEEIQEEVAAGYIVSNQIRDLYSVYRNRGKEQCYELACRYKDAKIKGIPIQLNPNRMKKSVKHHRKRGEIFVMQQHIQEIVGNSFATRCLAWASGEITNGSLYDDIGEIAKVQGKDYTPPEDLA